MSSGRLAEVRTPLILSILMVLMTQVGYLDLMNAYSGSEETLDEVEPVVAHSPATSVMHGNNTMWVSGANGPVQNAEYIALASDVILFQGTISKTSMNGCPMAYNASNATVWQPNTGATTSCAGSVKHYVTTIDDITYFTFSTTSSNNGNLYAYNPDNDTVYNVSWDFSNYVESAVAIGRTIYLSVPMAWYVGITGTHFAYNIDNQTTWALPSPAGTAWHHQQMMVVGTKIFVHAFTGSDVTNIGPQVFNTENNTWTNVTSMPTKGQFGRPAAGVVSNGQLLFIGSDDASITSPYTSGNGSEYWIYDSNNDTAWPLRDFCAGACHGALRFDADKGQPQIRDGTEMYFIARSYQTSTANQDHYDLWGYSTTNSTTWHMKNLSSNFSQVAVETSPGLPYPTSTYIRLAMLANGDFVIASRSQTSGGQHEMAFYSPTNDTLWQPTMETSDSLGFDVPSQFARMLGVYGNTVYLAYSSKLVAYNAANQTGVGQNVPGNQPDYLNGAPVLTGSTFAMANHCGNGVAISCPNGYRNTFLQWAPESVTVSDAWNLTPGQRIDGPITGGNGIQFNSGVGIQPMTASAAGAELLVGEAMTDITFEYTGLTTYGNYSTWQVTDFNSGQFTLPGLRMQILVGDTIYFNAAASTGTQLWAYDTSNQTYWQIEVQTGEILTEPGEYMNLLVGDTLYFSADNQSTGIELWAHDTSNHSSWLVSDIMSGAGDSKPGWRMNTLVGDTIYFSADNQSTGTELWAHDTSNHSTWRVDDINSGSGDSNPGNLMELLVGDTLYFSADDGSTGRELWAHNTSNNSDPWQVADINSGGSNGDPGKHLSMVVDDVLYFSADDGSTGGELYAYNTSNGSDPWLVADLYSGGTGSSPGDKLQILVDDTLYFDARGGNAVGRELYAYDTSNFSTWLVEDIYSGSGQSNPGGLFSALAGDTIYFSAWDGTTGVELWAHDTSNHSSWRVDDINSGSSSSNPGRNMQALIGDTLYFDANDGSTGGELWAYDTSNDSSWRVADIASGTGFGLLGQQVNMVSVFVDGTFYFTAQHGTNTEIWAHRPYDITPLSASVAGASCSVSPGLPSGLSIDSSTCTISGTPTSPSTNQTYTITAVMSGVTYQTTVWLSSAYRPLTPSVEGADLLIDASMTNITFQYNDSSAFTLANPSWTPTAVSTSANGPMGVHVADVDDDGDLDIVTASKKDASPGNVAWWENDGSGTWTANDIDTAADARSVYVEDIDGDGDLDVVAALYVEGTIKLYRNNGASNPVWTASNIDTNAAGATDVHVADMDGDGDLDVVSSSLLDNTIAWYENDGQASPGWTSTNIDTNRRSARAVDVADMDGDGDLDIVTASSFDHTIAWYANGGQSTPSFTKTDISNTANKARDVRAADMDGDGDIDIVSASYADNTIAWYENNGQATSWSNGVDIVTNASGAESVYVADLDNDGDLDIVSGSELDDTVAWYENDGQADPSWDAYDLSTSYDARGVHVADMDGDGDLEIISVSHNDNTVALFEQIGTRTWSNSMVNVTGATSCTTTPNLPTGLNIDSSTCTISGTPTVETINRTYTVTANISNVTYQGSVWLSTSPYATITSAVGGAHLNLGEAMTPITLNYTVNANVGNSSGSSGGTGGSSGSGSGSSSSSSFAYVNNKVSTGVDNTCAIADNGDLKCWGSDANGKLGDGGSDTPTNTPPSTAIDLDTGRTAVAVDVGSHHTCAILDNGDLKCWGWDAYGQLGDGGPAWTNLQRTNLNAPSSTAIDLGTGRTAVAVSAGAFHTCAILDNGDLKCWGRDDYGQLGDGGPAWTLNNPTDLNAPSSTAIDLGTGRTAVAVAAGFSHTCAILDNGDLQCWGADNHGQLGDGGSNTNTNAPSSTAINLGTGRTAVAVSTGDHFTCAILDNGDLKCWGRDHNGQLGDGGTTHGQFTQLPQPPTTPIDLGSGRTAVAVTGGSGHTCAILDNGEAKCWGMDSEGQLGDGGIVVQDGSTSTSEPSSTAIDLGTGRTAVAISTENSHVCAILDNGEMKCWGSDDDGALGDGAPNTNQPSPVAVSGSYTWDTTTISTTWETHPALPAGMSISGGTISGTPSVYALNQTYTIYANQSGYSTTHELYFSVDTDNAHTVVENQTIDPIGFHPPFNNGTTSWTVSPALPGNLTNSSTTGEITGMVNTTMSSAIYTVRATHSDGSVETFTFNLRSLADYDADGLPNDLPSDYDAAEGPTPGLVADTDDDGDGLDDSVETDTGNYVDGTNTGTDPLNPDTDGDGICDGPNAVSNVCIAGPDSDPNGAGLPATLVAVNNTAITTLAPYFTLSGGTYEYEPDLPDGLVMDANTGELSGTPTTTTGNTTYTVWLNNTNEEKLSYTFTIEVLEDSDGDGDPNELPGDYDPTNPDAPGLSEDLDDDNDGLPDTNETETGSYVDESDTGTSPTNPDTDGDGMCDGPNAVSNVCSAGPDAFPHDPSADTDTDGDGHPDTIDGDSTSDPPLVEDEDDDGDGLDDVDETDTGTYVDESDTGTNPLDPDTDNDGICDGPNAVPPVCVAGPDLTPLGEAAEGVVYLLNNTVMSSLTPQATGAGVTYEIWPDLPDGLNIDATSGVISGTPTQVITKTNFTVYGNGSGTPIVFSFFLQVLEDTDRDGEPNELPEDYPEDGDLVEDLDDDGDGASDLSETGTGIYNGADDLGTDSLNPDTDGDGICDGPNAVPPVCLAGPDSNPVGTGPFGPTVLVNNTEATPIQPPNSVPGATWELSPADLPDGLVFDSSTGVISGTPTKSMENRTYTIWANTTDPTFSVEATFWLQILEDYDGDGMPDQLPDDYPDTGEEPYTLIEDEDDDNDGMSDVDEGIIGTEPRNPDTDGDGFCDGGLGVEGVCFAGPDSDPLDPDLPVNTDGDAYPDDDPDGPGGLTADDDDDNDGFLDTLEIECASDPLDADDGPDDLDGDGICDLMDDDMDGDGIPNDDELGLPLDTASNNADTDGDGVCDGPNAVSDVCSAGPDAFPLDPAGAKDTDNDKKPDQLIPGVDSTSEPPLVEDFDDDDDTWSDVDELACGTSSPVDAGSVPLDTDGDGICDLLDPRLDLPFTLEYPTQHVDLFVNQTMPPLLPFINGSGEVNTWELVGELPEGLTFGWSPARDAVLDGSIRGTPVNATETVNLTVWANNTFYQESFALSLTVFNDSDNDSLPDTLPEGYVGNLTEDTDDDNDGLSDSQETACGSDPNNNASGEESWLAVCLRAGGDDRQDDGVNWMWCFPCLLLLLLLLVIPLLFGRDRRSIVMRSDGPEPENTTAEPNFVAGAGTEDDPFILAPVGPLQPGAIESTVEEITVGNMSEITVQMVDYNDDSNYGRFNMYESSFSMEGSRVLSVGKDGEVVINFKFDDSEFPTFEGGTYTARIKLGKASVHFLWDVTIMADDNKAEAEKKNTMTRIKKRKKSFDFERIGKATKRDADDLQVIKGIGPYSEEKLNALGIFTYAQLANFDRATEDEVNDAIEHYKGRIRRDEWVKQAQDIIGAQAKADEEALKAAEEAQAKAEAEAKAAEEAEAAKKAEAEAAAAAKKAEEKAAKEAKAAEEKAAKEAEKQAKAEADKKAKEEAAAKKKAEAEAKKAKAAEEKAAKEAAAAAAAEKKAKAEAEKKAKEEAAAKKKAEAEAKKAKAAEEKAAKEEAAAAEKKAKAEADKKAKEEAAAKKKAEAEAKKKAKPATKETKKQAELKRVKSRAKSIDFKVLGEAASSTLKTEVKKGATRLEVADTSQFADAGTAALEDTKGSTVISWTGKDGSSLTGVSGITRAFGKAAIVTSKDDLQVIKGIGPFIEEKLNALGITTYRQIANMNAKLEKQVNEAIEFFPGRVKRDQWATQAKILLGENVKLDEKALKQTEELERVAAKAEKIDFATLGVAVASEKDDLQSIKGIGPFIEEKLNALGIFTFEQVSKMTAKIEEEVNVAIEFFPGRVKRDEWAKQAKKLHKETK